MNRIKLELLRQKALNTKKNKKKSNQDQSDDEKEEGEITDDELDNINTYTRTDNNNYSYHKNYNDKNGKIIIINIIIITFYN